MKQTPALSALQVIAVAGILLGIVLGIFAVVNGSAVSDYVSLEGIAEKAALVGTLWAWATGLAGIGVTALLLILTAEVIVSSLTAQRKPAGKPTTAAAQVAAPAE